MRRPELPSIVKCAERLLVEIELAVRRWPRYHKYALGTELRHQATIVVELAHHAFVDRSRRLQWVSRLSFAIDSLKIKMQIGMRIEAFTSFDQFEALARVAEDLGRQCGGWQRRLTSNGQNAPAPAARAQRPETLSTRAAPKGVSI